MLGTKLVQRRKSVGYFWFKVEASLEGRRRPSLRDVNISITTYVADSAARIHCEREASELLNPWKRAPRYENYIETAMLWELWEASWHLY